ncbi:MAG: EamA family transporter RarD [Hydrogenophaga sp.]
MSALPQHSPQEQRRGFAITAFTFTLWGLVPVYWHLLKAVPSQQIIAHRIIWSTVLVVAWLLLSAGTGWWKQIAAQKRALPTLALSSLAIAFNWGLYIWAINAGHVIETSLGYFINPLVSVLLGVVVLKERLRGLQWLAVGCAAVGVSNAAQHGRIAR